LKKTNDSWRVDETYIKVGGKWMYLYRAVDSNGNTADHMIKKGQVVGIGKTDILGQK
jgi:IS6 family transposase